MAKLKKTFTGNFENLTQAFPYQKEAIDAVDELEYSAIFFEQGLGKTKIAIELTLEWLRSERIDTVIIVTKKGLVRNWLEEFGIHSHIKPKTLSSDRAANHKAIFSPCRVFVTNFEAIALEKEKIKAISKHRHIAIILDESQKIKNPDSKLTDSFFQLSSCFKIKVIMTGTPMANRPYDIWSQIFFLDEGKSLGKDFIKFKRKLDIPKGEDKSSYIEELGEIFPRISHFAIRQTKKGSGLELPGKVFDTVYADWEPRQLALYKKIKNDLRAEVTRKGRKVVDDAEALLKRLLRLLQVASNPKLVDEDYDANPGKFAPTESLVNQITSRGEKLIIWTSFVSNCRVLKHKFSHHGAVQIHGQMAIADRDKSVQRFKSDDGVSVLVATPAAAKEGLTLTSANHVVFYDRSFSLDDYLQAQDRIHRISQTKTCYVTNIVMNGSIDQWVDALITLKSAAVSVGMGDAEDEELTEVFEMDLEQILDEILREE